MGGEQRRALEDLYLQHEKALYNVAYTLKMNKKFAGMDYKVCGLEGLWWGDRAAGNFLDEPRESWHWKLIIRTPDAIGARDVKETIEQLLAKGKPATVAEVKLEAIAEGSCVQMLHVGPYATESESISRMLAFAAERGYAPHGLHHEIYLSDPRRVPPQRMRTILRFPVRKTRTPELAPA